MPSIDQRIKNLLKHVKANPRCNTDGIDADLAKDLINRNYIEGEISKTIGEPTYCSQLRLTALGEKKLESLGFFTLPNWFWPAVFGGLVTLLVGLVISFLGLK